MAPMADEAAFNDFVVARGPALTRTAYLLTHDHQLAEDLVQTALFKAPRRGTGSRVSPSRTSGGSCTPRTSRGGAGVGSPRRSSPRTTPRPSWGTTLTCT